MDSKEIFQALQMGTISPEDAEKELIKIMSIPVPIPVPEPKPITGPVLDVREIEPGIVQLTIQDRVNKNTISVELIILLMQAFEAIEANEDYKVAILTGYDNYFISGGDKEGMLAIYEGKAKLTDVKTYRLPLDCKIPVIAAMQGHGIGGGWCMGMFCDFIIMSRDSTYTCNHMKYGFTPGDGATIIFPEKFGLGLAQEILFTGKRYRGSELAAKGIPYPVLPRNEVLPYAIWLAQELAQTPRESLVLLKAHLTDSLKNKLAGVVEKEWEMQEKTFFNKPEILERMLAVFDQSARPHAASIDRSDQPSIPVSAPQNQAGLTPKSSELLQLNRSTEGRSVFWLHGDGGGLEGYQAIAAQCQRPFYGIQAKGRMTDEPPNHGIRAMAAHYIGIIQSIQPEGPYDLGGYSLGGVLAYEVTRQLQESGQTVNTIVMLDALGGTGLKKAQLSRKTMILQAVNMSLVYRLRQEPQKLLQKLIHQREVDFHLDDEELLRQLIALGKTRGLSLTLPEAELQHLFLRNLKIQEAFEFDQYQVLPLAHPRAVTCYYFGNKSGVFFGEFEPYLSGADDINTLDHTDYWSEWERQLPNFKRISVDSSNHMTLLLEAKAYEAIGAFCEKLYSEAGLPPEFSESLQTDTPVQDGIRPKENTNERSKEVIAMNEFQLPKEFLMGSTAPAVLIEGGNQNTDWFRWCETPGHIADGSHVIRGTDHWNRYAEDIQIMKELSHDTCCMSVEWSRIEPEQGKYDPEAIRRYRDEILLLRQNGIQPLVTLHFFSLPLWLADMGGWESPAIVDIFTCFTRFVVNQLGDLVSDWLTTDDPNLGLFAGYQWGWWPPGKKDGKTMLQAMRHMILAHIHGYREIHKIRTENQFPMVTRVGFALHFRIFEAADGKFMNKLWARLLQYMFSDLILAGLTTGKFTFPLGFNGYPAGKGKFYDFLGINYFTRSKVNMKSAFQNQSAKAQTAETADHEEEKWEAYPEGLYRFCKKYYLKYQAPIFITSNGMYDPEGDKKIKYIYDHLWQVARLIREGIPVERYYHWTLVDLFETHSGENRRLGLVANNFETQERTILESGRFYGEICQQKAITREMIAKYIPDSLSSVS